MIAVDTRAPEGLCGTCNNEPTCFYHAHRGPALFCEMFDNFVPPDVILAGRSTGSAARPFSVRYAGQSPAKQAGLCVNCEHASQCGHEKAEGGVWHCEDYE